MPVHINEIVIRANIVEPTQDKKPVGDKTQKTSEAIDRDEIISEAVTQVLQILRLKKER